MRDRVVSVHQLESFAQRHLVLLHRERELVGRVLEQRIVRRDHLVEGDALGEPAAQAERARVGDDMHVVAAPGELEAQLGRDGAGAAVRRVTGDADAHQAFSVIRRPSSVAARQAVQRS